jgi:dolichol-phosphate mannosyltransferase
LSFAVKQKIIIIIPVYNEQESIAPLVQRTMAVTSTLTAYTFELLFVDDGSCDNSVVEIEKQITKGLPVGYIQLSRNFGHQAALEAGLSAANADAVITMDGDLQHPPEEIVRMVAEYEKGADVVQMQRTNTSESIKGILSVAFYSFFSKVGGSVIVPNAADFRLLNRAVLTNIKKFNGKGMLLRAIVPALGFNQTLLPYTQPQRKFGKPKYTYFSSYELALHTTFKFSRFPAHFTSLTGVLLLLGGLVMYMLRGLYLIPDNRHTFFIPLFLMLGGLVFIATSIVCWYMYFILEQVRHDPGFVVQKVVIPSPTQQ